MTEKGAPGRELAAARLLGLVAFAAALGIVSNSLEPALLGHKALELIPEHKNTAIGLATFAGLIVAALVEPVIGAWSDRAGRRRLPFLAVGSAVAAVSLLVLAAAPVFGLVVLALLLIQVGTNTAQAPWQALIPDHVPSGQRGRAAGLKALLEILGFVGGRALSGRWVAQGNLLAAAVVPGLALALALGVTIAALRGLPSAAPAEPRPVSAPGFLATVRRIAAIDVRAHPGFPWWFVNRTLFWGGFIAINTFMLFFLIDVHGMPEASAQRFVADVSTVLGGAILILSVPAGWLSDRIGRRPLVAASGLAAAAGTGLLIWAPTLPGLMVGGAVLGLGIGVWLSADWALLTDLVPRAEAARYLGIANLAAAGGSAGARLVGGVLIDPLIRWTGEARLGYNVVFLGALIGFLLAAWAITRIPGPEPRGAA